MAILGLRSLNGNQFLYSEGNGGQSAASGIDSNTNNFKIVLSSTPGATPAGSAIIEIEPGANGNMNLTPNGSGSVVISNTTIQSGSIDGTIIGTTVPSTVNATSYSLNGNPIALLSWQAVTGGTQAMAVSTGYIAANSGGVVAFTLPATGALGDTIRIAGDSVNGNGWTLAQGSGQYIVIGASTTTVGAGGSLASTVNSDAIEMICITAGASTGWSVVSSMGNITVV